MKRISLYLVPALAAAISISSCSDLDTNPMDQTVTAGQKVDAKEQNPEMVLAGVSGVASTFNAFMTVLDQHNDFGYPALMLFSDCRGVDMVSPNSGYNWFATSAEWSDCNVNSDFTDIAWGIYYQQIFAANAVLADIDSLTTDPLLQFYRAQALSFRAFDYMMLAQLYQFPYPGHETEPCVMLITEENAEEAAKAGCSRSTVAETYARIISDLNDAVTLLSESGVTPADVISSKPKRFLTLAAAYGLRARANLLMEKWTEAADDATSAIIAAQRDGIYPLSAAEASVPGFNDISAHNWIWGDAIAETDRVVTSGIVNFPSHMGSLCYGYASVGAYRSINQKLFESIPKTDVRRAWWLDADGISATLPAAMQNYCSSRGVPPYATVKYAPYQNEPGTSNNASDIPLMRVEEMYLILAEAEAMGSSPAQGAATLAGFVSTYRDPSYTCQATSATDVRDEILTQRRIELWGEGITYYDFLRMNKEFDRRGGGFPTEWCYVVPAGSNLLRLPIPDSEVQGNEKFRNDGNNNPGAARPVAVTDL